MSEPGPGLEESFPPSPTQGAERERALTQILALLSVILIANALIPILLGDGALSDQSSSKVLVVSLSGPVLALASLISTRAWTNRRLLLACVAATLFGLAGLHGTDWSAVGWGTLAVLGAFAIPTVVKLGRK